MIPHYSTGNWTTKVNIAFVSDGHPSQLLGIAYIINSLNVEGRERAFPYPIWLVLPETKRQVAERWLRFGCGDLDFRFVNAEHRKDDKYYIQLSLTKVISLLSNEDILLALDYDHLVLKPDAFPFESPYSDILVSSEASDDVVSQLSPSIKTLPMGMALPKRHLNASLIYGEATELNKLIPYWLKSYEEMSPYVSVRHRVELALTMASERANVNAMPCDIRIQSNFAFASLDCCLFTTAANLYMPLS